MIVNYLAIRRTLQRRISRITTLLELKLYRIQVHDDKTTYKALNAHIKVESIEHYIERRITRIIEDVSLVFGIVIFPLIWSRRPLKQKGGYKLTRDQTIIKRGGLHVKL